jgi:hypothetical protein
VNPVHVAAVAEPTGVLTTVQDGASGRVDALN